MKEDKKLFRIQIVASIMLLSSKVLLATGYPIAWVISAMGYMLVTYFNYKKKLKVMIITVSFLTFASFYGYYKTLVTLTGLTYLDWIVIGITSLLALYVIYLQTSNKELPKQIIQLQIGATLTTMSAFILLGLKFDYGWMALLSAHIILGFMYKRIGKSNIFVLLQIISACIALWKILNIWVFV
jgi:hypothetical protein